MAKTVRTSHQGWFFTAALTLVFYGIMRWELRNSGIFFVATGFLMFIPALSKAKIMGRPLAEALVLWLAAVCFLVASLQSFSGNRIVWPWILLVLAIIYSWRGYQTSGLKKL